MRSASSSTRSRRPARDWFPALKALDFAGALVLDEGQQADALALADRASLEASEVGAADALTVTQAGVVADYHFGRALVQALRSRLWDPRGARVIVVGGGRRGARRGASVGERRRRHLTLLATSRPDAERMVPQLAASTDVVATVPDDPIAVRLLEQAPT
jgi:shikimate 5-dehydrogenase